MDKVRHVNFSCNGKANMRHGVRKIRDMAIAQLSACGLSPIEKIQYARECHVSSWFIEGITALANEITKYEVRDLAEAVGWETTALVFDIREKARPKTHEAMGWLDGCTCCNCGSRLATTEFVAARNTQIVCCTGGECRWQIKRTLGVPPRMGEMQRELAIPQDVVLAIFDDEIKTLRY